MSNDQMFQTRLAAAMDSHLDSKSDRELFLRAVDTVSKILGEWSVAVTLNTEAGILSPDRAIGDPAVSIFTGGKRLPVWMRTIVDELGDLTDCRIRIVKDGDNVKVVATSDYTMLISSARQIFNWLILCVDRLTKTHLDQLTLGRGAAKSEGTKFRNSLVTELLANAHHQHETTVKRLMSDVKNELPQEPEPVAEKSVESVELLW